MNVITVAAKRMNPNARLPQYAHGPEEEAGMDLCAADEVRLAPGQRAAVGTGLALELPAGFEGQVRPRSGLALRHGVTLLNAPGTIDPGYRGEIRVIMINLGESEFHIRPGDRIAQLVVASYAAVEWRLESALTVSARGDGGFGSTGTR